MNQIRTHYASLIQVGLDGSEDALKFYGGCFVIGCMQHTDCTFDLESVESWIREHNALPPMELPAGAPTEVDWYGGRALMPWEQEYTEDSKRGILFGPGRV